MTPTLPVAATCALTRIRLFPPLCVLMFLAIPAIVFATPVPLYSATTTDGTSNSNSSGAASTGLVTVPFTPGAGSSYSRQESSAANPNGLHTASTSTINQLAAAGLGNISVTGDATASASYGDFLISGPGSGNVSGSVNLRLDGTIGTSIDHGGVFIGLLQSEVDLSVTGRVAGQTFDGSYSQTHSVSTYCDGNTPVCSDTMSANGSGLLGGSGSLPVNLTTTDFVLPLNTPFTFTLEFDLSSVANGSVFGTGCDATGCNASYLINTIGDFANTLWFPTSGPVFNLPNGYTLNSLAAGITDNAIGAVPAAVPEPATLTLLGTGLLTLCRRRTRTRKA